MKEIPEGQPQIPKHWKFVEKDWVEAGNPRIRILQLEKNFLAICGELNLADEKDFFFDEKGNAIYERGFRDISEFYSQYRSQIFILNKTGEITSICHIFGAEADKSSIIFSFERATEDKVIGDNPYANTSFKNGKLITISLGGLFDVDKEGNEIMSPECDVSFHKDSTPSSFNLQPSSSFNLKPLNPETWGWEIENDRKEIIYKIGWKYGDNGNFFLTQVHILTGIKKVLEAPLQLDLANIRKAVLVKPPYKKIKAGDLEHLDVPWRDIDKILGVSLSYSYPIPQEKQG
ncbi:MAG: hypothetical protein HW400_719 [Candidatus Levybacteria bacterium]|nr:hypothetical protein [Candidatus Levybacteria bacterium]